LNVVFLNYSSVNFTVGQDFTASFRVYVDTSVYDLVIPEIQHSNLHACKVSVGFCSPLVKNQTNLVTFGSDSTFNFAPNSSYLDITGSIPGDGLVLGEWSVIAHIRIKLTNGDTWDVANGIKVSVNPACIFENISIGAYISVSIILFITFIYVLTVLLGVIIFRNRKVFLASNLTFNVTVLISAIFILGTVIPLSIQGKESTCILRPWLLAPAATCVFALLFFKTWRVWRIFTNQTYKLVLISDWIILRNVGIIVAGQIIIQIVWSAQGTSKPNQQLYSGGFKKKWTCDSPLPYPIISVVYTGIILIATLIIAFITRKVLTLFNESKWIAYCVYNLTIIACIIIPMQWNFDDPTTVYCLRAFGIIGCVFVGVSFLFLPKFHMVFSISDSDLQRLEQDRNLRSGSSNATTMNTLSNKESETQPDLVWDPEEQTNNENAETKDVVDKDIVISHNWQRKYLKGHRLHEDVQTALEQIVDESRNLLAKQKTGVAIKGEDMMALLKLLRDEKFKTA